MVVTKYFDYDGVEYWITYNKSGGSLIPILGKYVGKIHDLKVHWPLKPKGTSVHSISPKRGVIDGGDSTYRYTEGNLLPGTWLCLEPAGDSKFIQLSKLRDFTTKKKSA